MSSRHYDNWNYPPNYYEFDPSTLMAEGDGSLWYDLGDWNYMFTDTAMTTKVTAAGQAVAAVKDKGPNGYHLFQETVGRRPVSAIQGGYKCLDFDSVLGQGLYSVSTSCDVAINVCHGWCVIECDDNGIFQRVLSVGNATGADTAGLASFCIHTMDNTGIMGLRANGSLVNAVIPGTVTTPFDNYEWQMNGANSTQIWRDGTDNNVDSGHAALNARSNGRIAVGTTISANAQVTVPTAGHIQGRLYNLIHLGNVPSGPNRSKVTQWLKDWRY